MNARWKITAALALVAGGSLAWWQLRRTDVVVTAVVRGRAVDAVYATGTVEAEDRVSVKAKLPGSIAECLVREGDVVKKGDMLARIDNPGVSFALQRGRAQLNAASRQAGPQSPQMSSLASQATSIRAEIALVKTEVTRAKQLASSGTTSTVELEKLTTRLEQLESQLRANESQQEGLRIDLDANAAQLTENVKALASQVSDTDVRAPHDGIVLRRNIEPGEVVAQNQPLFDIGDTSRLILKVAVDEADVGKVTTDPSSIAIATLYAFRDRVFEGKVTRILPDADRATKSFVAYVVLDGAPAGLRSGMSAEVNIVVSRRDDVLIAPMEAIDGKWIWVAEAGRARKKMVNVGIHDLLRAEVQSGLSEGDLVILDGQATLSDGTRVSTRTIEPARPGPADPPSAKR